MIEIAIAIGTIVSLFSLIFVLYLIEHKENKQVERKVDNPKEVRKFSRIVDE